MEIDPGHGIYVYIPQSGDDVFQDMEISVIGFHGPLDKARECHEKISDCLSTDEERNELVLSNMLIGGGLVSAEDLYPQMSTEEMDKKLVYLQDVSAFANGVTWFTLDSKKQLRQPLYKNAHKTIVPYVYYHTGGFALSMGGW